MLASWPLRARGRGDGVGDANELAPLYATNVTLQMSL
jgi:hypothetical protein